MIKTLHSSLRATLLALALVVASAAVSLAAAKPIHFVQPSWPGINVKTAVITQLLDALGYKTKTSNLGLSFVFRGLSTGDADVFMGAWLPAEKDMLEPLVKKKKVTKLKQNLSGAIEGLAVPKYTWDSGIHSVKDLAKHGDKFDHKIYGIESGSAMNQAFNKAIDDNYEGLGGWQVIPSSTAVMLTQVKRATKKKKPIVFFGWRPHWMDARFSLKYLKDKKGSKIASIRSQVWTVVTASLPKAHPNVARFLRQFHVDSNTQNQWIDHFSHQKEAKDKVAHDWLANHKKQVLKWLDGVKTADGKSAAEAYKKKFL